MTQLRIIVGVSYLYNDDIQGWSGHGSLSLSLAVSVAARVGRDEDAGRQGIGQDCGSKVRKSA